VRIGIALIAIGLVLMVIGHLQHDQQNCVEVVEVPTTD